MCSKVGGFFASFWEQVRERVGPCCGRIDDFLEERNIHCSGAKKSFSNDMAKLKDDIRTMKFWRAVVAEFLGVFFLVIIGCGAWTQTHEFDGALDSQTSPRPTVRISLAMGFTYGAILWCVKCVSEGHLNPSITLAFLVTRRISFLRCGLYILSQFFGGIFGGVILLGLTPGVHRDTMGATTLAPGVTQAQGFGVEFFATFMLCFVVFASYEKTRKDEVACVPFVLGITLAAASLFSVPYSGGSMNTARSFGPALAAAVWKHHWIYWFGPVLGGICGGATYDVIFSTRSSYHRLKSCFLMFHKGESPSHQPRPTPRDPEEELDQPEAEREHLQPTTIVIHNQADSPRNAARMDHVAEESDDDFEELDIDNNSMPPLEGDPPKRPPRVKKTSDRSDGDTDEDVDKKEKEKEKEKRDADAIEPDAVV